MTARTIIKGFLAISLLTTTTAFAASDVKIGVIDLQRIVFESKAGKAGIAEIKTFQEARQKEITAKEQQLLKAKQDFESQQFTLTEDAKKVLAEQLQEKEIDLKRLLEDSDRDLRKRRNELLQVINKDVTDVIQEYGKNKGFALLVEKDSAAILFSDAKMDVTDDIIKQYDKASR